MFIFSKVSSSEHASEKAHQSALSNFHGRASQWSTCLHMWVSSFLRAHHMPAYVQWQLFCLDIHLLHRQLVLRANESICFSTCLKVYVLKLTFAVTKSEKLFTHRGIMSTVCSLFDLLRLVSPFTLPAKRIMQELCIKKMNWDDELPDIELNSWKEWTRDLLRWICCFFSVSSLFSLQTKFFLHLKTC